MTVGSWVDGCVSILVGLVGGYGGKRYVSELVVVVGGWLGQYVGMFGLWVDGYIVEGWIGLYVVGWVGMVGGLMCLYVGRLVGG